MLETLTFAVRCRRFLSHCAQVSEACQDLLRRMMTADPLQRISVQGIMQHPWFLHDLPPGTLDVNAQLQATDTERYAAAFSLSRKVSCNLQARVHLFLT